ncbi:MAG: hypothetical protein R6U98_34575 [Pirellulaceae bacterium]
MDTHSQFARSAGFAVGTGRCGTTFLSRVVALEEKVASSHCRHPLAETFHRYCRWYQLPVDEAGFLATMEEGVREDLKEHRFSFESSGYLALSIVPLHRHFQCRFVLLVRRPEQVVNSHVHKGWYGTPFVQADAGLALGYQNSEEFHHFLGRIAPRGDEFSRWNELTQVGKLAWYWNALNRAALDQFDQLPESEWRVQKLEELDHQAYCELARFLGFQPTVARKDFDALAANRPNARPNRPTTKSWSTRERREFQEHVATLADELGYEWRTEELVKSVGERTLPREKRTSYRERLSTWLGISAG